MQVRKLMEASTLAQLIGNIGRQRVEFDTAVQAAAVECIGQSIVHRNITPAQQLLDVVGAHLKDVLVAHFEKFGNIAYIKADKKLAFYEVKPKGEHPAVKNGGVVGDVLVFAAQYAEHIESTPWVKAKKENEPKSVFDVEEEVEKFLDRFVKFAKRGGELKNKPLLELMLDVKNRYSAEAYLAKAKAADVDPKVLEAEAVIARRDANASPEKVQELAAHFNGAAAVGQN